MKQFFLLLAANAIAIILASLACYMVYTDKKGYGWVIFAALICAVYPKKM
jgi:hypothetical protein